MQIKILDKTLNWTWNLLKLLLLLWAKKSNSYPNFDQNRWIMLVWLRSIERCHIVRPCGWVSVFSVVFANWLDTNQLTVPVVIPPLSSFSFHEQNLISLVIRALAILGHERNLLLYSFTHEHFALHLIGWSLLYGPGSSRAGAPGALDTGSVPGLDRKLAGVTTFLKIISCLKYEYHNLYQISRPENARPNNR